MEARIVRRQRDFVPGAIHRELVVSPLEVVVRKNRAAHDGQIGVGAEEIVRELLHKGEQAAEAGLGNRHRAMNIAQHDAMLVII